MVEKIVKLFVRLPGDVHAALVDRARREQRSLNSQLVYMLRIALNLPPQ